MTEAFGGKLISEGLASRALGFLLTCFAQTPYTNVIYPRTYNPNRLPVIERSLCYAVPFPQCLLQRQNINCFQQGLPKVTHSLIDNSLRRLLSPTLHDLYSVKQYGLTVGTAERARQAPFPSISTLSTIRNGAQAVHYVPDNLSMVSFPTSPQTSLSVKQSPYGQHLFILNDWREWLVNLSGSGWFSMEAYWSKNVQPILTMPWRFYSLLKTCPAMYDNASDFHFRAGTMFQKRLRWFLSITVVLVERSGNF